MFKKALYFTDLHQGRRQNNDIDLQDNDAFIDWMIGEGMARGCDLCIFGGDFFDSRSSIQLITLNRALDIMKKLNDAFPKTYLIKGNHDLYLRHSREISSVEIARNFKNIEIIDHPTAMGETMFLPWLVGDERKQKLAKSRYVFGHLEIPGFMMNARVMLPDVAHASNADLFEANEFVFTGHFHLRQHKNNIVYPGAAMPYNFSDNWDDQRGVMIFEWGGTPQYVAWPKQPLFRTMKLSELLDDPDRFLCEKLTARITLDIDISYEEAQLIKDTFVDSHKLRRVELIPRAPRADSQELASDIVFQSVDQIVIDGLLSIESVGMKAETLVDIYRQLQ